MPDPPSRFYAYLKDLPPPFSYVGATIEFLARLLGLRFALLLLAGHSLGIVIVIALIMLDQLPFKEHLYVSKADHEQVKADHEQVRSELGATKAKLEALNDVERKLEKLQDHVNRTEDPQYRLWLEFPENEAHIVGDEVLFAWDYKTPYDGGYKLEVRNLSEQIVRTEMVPTGQHKTWRIPDLRPGEYIWRLIPKTLPTAAPNYYKYFDLYGNVVDRVKARKKLVVGSSLTEGAVFQHKNEDSEEWGGFDIELMRVIARHMDVEPDFVAFRWSDLFEELKRQRVDVVISGMTRLPDREKDHGVMFTDGYVTTHQRLVTRAGADGVRFPESLRTAKIGVVGGDPETTNSRALRFLHKQWKSKYPFDIVPHNRLIDLVSAVKRGDVLMGLFDDLNALSHVKQGNLKWVGPPLDEHLKAFYRDELRISSEEYAMAVVDKGLRDQINVLLPNVREDICRLRLKYRISAMEEDAKDGTCEN